MIDLDAVDFAVLSFFGVDLADFFTLASLFEPSNLPYFADGVFFVDSTRLPV